MGKSQVPILSLKALSYTIPTDQPESDGTIQWSSTELVSTQARAGNTVDMEYTCAFRASAKG